MFDLCQFKRSSSFYQLIQVSCCSSKQYFSSSLSRSFSLLCHDQMRAELFHALRCSDSDWHQSMFIISMTSHCFIARKCFSSRPECGNLWYDVIGLLKLGPWWCYSLIVSFSRYIEINWSSDRIQLLIRHHWAACGAVNKLSCCKRFQLIAGVIHFRSINHYHLDAS